MSRILVDLGDEDITALDTLAQANGRSRAAELPDSYTRYLVNGLRDSFGLDGVPIRLIFRKGDNPYADKG